MTPNAASVVERRALGQELRRTVPRGAHAVWSPGADRDPVANVLANEADRIPALLPLRHRRMAADAFGFLRGSASLMAADLATVPQSGIKVVASGDAHLGNFGAVAAPDGTALFDVNDFDEAAAAPFEWDVKRLASSLAVAGAVQGLAPRATTALARRVAQTYRRRMSALAEVPPLEAWRSRVPLTDLIEDIADREVRRRERQRLAETVRESRSTYAGLVSAAGDLTLPERPPRIFRLGEHEQTAHAAFANYVAGLRPDQAALLDHYRLRDVAFKAVGVGSLGLFCAIGLFATGDSDVLLLQLKEARASVLEPYTGASPYPTHGLRVVAAQRTMQAAPDPLLGWTTAPVDGRFFYIRILADPRLAAAAVRIESGGLRFYASLCAHTLARAHARSGDAAMIAGYLGDGDAFDRAIAEFAASYAKQTIRDHAAWLAAIRRGEIEVA